MYRNQFSGNEYFRLALKAISAHDSDECLNWPFKVDAHGYARITHEGRRELLHRVAFKLKYGRYPEPCGLHKCDNRRCYNWRHIEEGTVYLNNQQRIDRGRSIHLKGIDLACSKLTETQVQEIRQLRKHGMYLKDIAVKFGVTFSTIHVITTGKTWKHLK